MCLRGLPGYSYGTIERLELLPDEPESSDATNRGRAFVLLTIYGYAPEQFGITDDDCPPFIDPNALAAMAEDWPDGLGVSPSAWYGEVIDFGARRAEALAETDSPTRIAA